MTVWWARMDIGTSANHDIRTYRDPAVQDTAEVPVRLLDPHDHNLLDAAVRRFRGAAVADHTPFLADPATIAFVAMEGTAVVGWVWGTRQRHAAGYSQVQLYEIEVAPEWRQRGIGRALITAFHTLVTGEGHRRMWLFTDEQNAAAQALYRSVGGEPSRHDDAAFWWQLGDPAGR